MLLLWQLFFVSSILLLYACVAFMFTCEKSNVDLICVWVVPACFPPRGGLAEDSSIFSNKWSLLVPKTKCTGCTTVNNRGVLRKTYELASTLVSHLVIDFSCYLSSLSWLETLIGVTADCS